MGIWMYEIWNKGENKAVFNFQGESRQLSRGNGVTPNWCLGDRSDPLLVHTSLGDESDTWNVYDDNWEMHFNVVSNGQASRWLGNIKVLRNYGRFNVWASDDRIVIGNDDGKLGRESDGKTFPYFLVTPRGIQPFDAFPL